MLASKLMSIGVIVLSAAIGFLIFYVISPAPKERKWQYVEEMIFYLINFIVFIWIGKIVLRFSVFITDPLAVLAHPSNSGDFYFAILCMVVVLLYQSKRDRIDLKDFIGSALPVLFAVSFIYEFIQLVWSGYTYTFGYLILLTLLLVLWIGLAGRISLGKQILLLFSGWSIGMVILSVTQPIVTVFGYIMESWFVGICIALGLLIVWQKGKSNRPCLLHGRN